MVRDRSAENDVDDGCCRHRRWIHHLCSANHGTTHTSAHTSSDKTAILLAKQHSNTDTRLWSNGTHLAANITAIDSVTNGGANGEWAAGSVLSDRKGLQRARKLPSCHGVGARMRYQYQFRHVLRTVPTTTPAGPMQPKLPQRLVRPGVHHPDATNGGGCGYDLDRG
jgi:hypothetical protein